MMANLKTKKKKNKEVDKSVYYSVVVPAYNEQENIAELDKEIKEVMDSLKKTYEIIYVDDGSQDNTLNELKKLKNIKIIEFARNFGQSSALDIGFKESRGEIIITLDGDLQNDPKDIPRLLNKLHAENLDVVAGWRVKRKDAARIKILTIIGRRLRGLLLSDVVHDSGCMLRVYKKPAVKNLELWGEMHRYALQLLKGKGFKIGELQVNHRPRIHGKTKYGCDKAIRGFVDLLYIWFLQKYHQRPLHLFGIMGLASSFFGIIALIYSFSSKIFYHTALNRDGWFFLGFFLLLTGIMLFSFGLILDLLIKIQQMVSPYSKRYYIREIIEN